MFTVSYLIGSLLHFITKCGSSYKMCQVFYYKMELFLQNASILLQNATVITKCIGTLFLKISQYSPGKHLWQSLFLISYVKYQIIK